MDTIVIHIDTIAILIVDIIAIHIDIIVIFVDNIAIHIIDIIAIFIDIIDIIFDLISGISMKHRHSCRGSSQDKKEDEEGVASHPAEITSP